MVQLLNRVDVSVYPNKLNSLIVLIPNSLANILAHLYMHIITGACMFYRTCTGQKLLVMPVFAGNSELCIEKVAI